MLAFVLKICYCHRLDITIRTFTPYVNNDIDNITNKYLANWNSDLL